MKKEKNQPEPLEYGTLVAPSFYGTGAILTWDTKLLIESVDRKKLYASYWQNGKSSNSKLPHVDEADFNELFDMLIQEIVADNLIDARGFYGFFPVISDDDKLVLLSFDDYHTEIASFLFPCLEEKKWRSFADYFRPEGDIFSVLIVTTGFKLSNQCRRYRENKDIKGFYLNGIGDYIIQMLTTKLSVEITKTLFLPKNQGLVCVFGKPGMPGLDEQKKLLELMCAEDRLSITLSEEFQLQPEHSSLCIFAHHPEAGFFNSL